MSALIEAPPWLCRQFPEAGPELLQLFAQAGEQAGLLHADFGTIRDLVELSGYEKEEPLHALLLVLLLALDEGSLCVQASAAALAGRLEDLVGPDSARDWAQRMAAALDKPGYPELIGTDLTEAKPVILHECRGRRFLYFHKYLTHEKSLAKALEQRLTSAGAAPLPGDLSVVLKEVLHEQPLHARGQPVRLNAGQQRALALALLRDFAIVSGGPGTGKTSIVFALLRCLVRCGIAAERIALAAPTGRAAQRLSDAVRAGLDNLPGGDKGADASLKDLPARTLHTLLGYQPTRGTFRHHVENPLPADVVIVDEVSMVGLALMTRLLEATPQARLVLLGDKDQLPSVEAGALLAQLVPADGKPRFSPELAKRLAVLLPDLEPPTAGAAHPLRDALVVLEENYRSQQAIQDVAAAVNRQDPALTDRLPRCAVGRAKSAPDIPTSFGDLEQRGGCWFHEAADGNVAAWRRVLTAWAEHAYLGSASYVDLAGRCRVVVGETVSVEEQEKFARLFAALERCRVLTLLRDGPWGCTMVNSFLEQVLRPRLDPRGSGVLFAGAPVLITRNDSIRQLYNGDVGVALRSERGLRVVFPQQGGYRSFPVDALPAHELAFALTVHKSQGSEYGQVLLALPPAGGRRLLTKELLYTGITRAKHLAVICGTKEALRAALARKIERESALLDFSAK